MHITLGLQNLQTNYKKRQKTDELYNKCYVLLHKQRITKSRKAKMSHIKQGYKQTEVGVIPEDWDTNEFGELTERIIGDGTPSRSNPLYWGNEIPWVTVKDLATFNCSQTQEYITKKGLKNSASHLIPKGIIITSTRMALGKAVIYDVDVSINQDLKAIFPKKNIDTKFFYYWFQFNSKFIEDLGSGSTVMGLSLPDLRKIIVAFPPKSEQTAIANALSDTDVLISCLEKLIAKKRNIKQGAMQKLLQPKKGWKVMKLGEVAIFLKGKGLPKSHIQENGKLKCIHYGELFTKYNEFIGNILSYTNENENSFYSVSNDVLMPTSDVTPNGLATASCIKEDGIILGGDVLIIRLQKNVMDGIFLSYYIAQNREQIMKLVSGSTVYHLYGSDMKNFEIIVPEIKEQICIATIFLDMDLEITSIETKLAKYRNIKLGMMQNLLTGKIRLI